MTRQRTIRDDLTCDDCGLMFLDSQHASEHRCVADMDRHYDAIQAETARRSGLQFLRDGHYEAAAYALGQWAKLRIRRGLR